MAAACVVLSEKLKSNRCDLVSHKPTAIGEGTSTTLSSEVNDG